VGQEIIIPGLEGISGVLRTETVPYGDNLRSLQRRLKPRKKSCRIESDLGLGPRPETFLLARAGFRPLNKVPHFKLARRNWPGLLWLGKKNFLPALAKPKGGKLLLWKRNGRIFRPKKLGRIILGTGLEGRKNFPIPALRTRSPWYFGRLLPLGTGLVLITGFPFCWKTEKRITGQRVAVPLFFSGKTWIKLPLVQGGYRLVIRRSPGVEGRVTL